MFLQSRRIPAGLCSGIAGAPSRRMVLALLQVAGLAAALPCSPSAAQDLTSVGSTDARSDSSRKCQEAVGGDRVWVLRAGISGGIDGRIVSITIDGHRKLEATHSRADATCTVELGRDQVRTVEAMIERSQPERWRPTYDAGGQTCCDRIVASLRLERDEAGQTRVFETRWLLSGKVKVPDEIRQLFVAVVGAQESCSSRP